MGRGNAAAEGQQDEGDAGAVREMVLLRFVWHALFVFNNNLGFTKEWWCAAFSSVLESLQSKWPRALKGWLCWYSVLTMHSRDGVGRRSTQVDHEDTQ